MWKVWEICFGNCSQLSPWSVLVGQKLIEEVLQDTFQKQFSFPHHYYPVKSCNGNKLAWILQKQHLNTKETQLLQFFTSMKSDKSLIYNPQIGQGKCFRILFINSPLYILLYKFWENFSPKFWHNSLSLKKIVSSQLFCSHLTPGLQSTQHKTWILEVFVNIIHICLPIFLYCT